MRITPVFLPIAGIVITGLALTVFFSVENRHTDSPVVPPIRQPLAKNLPFETESDPARRGQLLRDWAETIKNNEMGAMLADIERDVGPDLRPEMRRELLASWVRRDLTGFVKWFEARNAADELHQDALRTLVASLSAQGPERGFQTMEESFPPPVREELYGPFFRQWANINPASAADTLKGVAAAAPGARTWTDLIGQVVTQWSRGDLDGAVAWTKSLPAGAEKTHALVQLSYEWTDRAPAAAAEYARAQNDPALIRIVAAKWAEADPRTALAWAGDMPAGDSKNSAVTAALTTWAQNDPASAALYVDRLTAPAGGSQATLAVVSVWAQADPAQASHWVSRFPEGSVRESAMGQLVEAWAANNTEAAGRWIQQLPATRSRDVAVGAFCSAIAPMNPEKAFEWARLISDETLRTQTMETAASAWIDRPKAGTL